MGSRGRGLVLPPSLYQISVLPTMCSLLPATLLLLLSSTVRASTWSGQFIFEGVGFGIGRLATEFTADLQIAAGRLSGTGRDENGGFRLDGTTRLFTKKYNDPSCDLIEYTVKEASAREMRGSYRFSRCSTAQYKARNPFLGLFAPSTSTGAGTWSMSCTSQC